MVETSHRYGRNNFLVCLILYFGLFVLPVRAQLFTPPSVYLTPEGVNLIVEFETGGKSEYNPHPEWPGYRSGITWGIGYDGGQTSKQNILNDWRESDARYRLQNTSGITGNAARIILHDYIDIVIDWGLAQNVFLAVDVPREWQLCKRTFPGFEDLCPNSQGALISLIYNRGASLEGPRREEMREIARLTRSRNYPEIAHQFRKMARQWQGTDIYNGMRRRRFAEADLVETCTKESR